MALRYGGEVSTKSTDFDLMGILRASPPRTRAAGPRSGAPESMQLAATRLAAATNPENGSEGARSKALCGLLWDRSLAREAPDSLVMMRRENAHQRASRTPGSSTLPISRDSDKSCDRARRSNQNSRNPRVSRSQPWGKDSAARNARRAAESTAAARPPTSDGSMGVVQTLEISTASGSTSMATARCPMARATAGTVPEPDIGSSTRERSLHRPISSSASSGAILAGNGCTGFLFRRPYAAACCLLAIARASRGPVVVFLYGHFYGVYGVLCALIQHHLVVVCPDGPLRHLHHGLAHVLQLAVC